MNLSKTCVLLTTLLAITALLRLAPSPAEARGAGGEFRGTVRVGRLFETFTIPEGYTARGSLGDARERIDVRELLFVPSHFGELVTITSHGETAIIWYRDGDGALRNVIVPDATRDTYLLETQTTTVRSARRSSGR